MATTRTRHIEAFRGDAFDVKYQIDADITGHQIRCEIWNSPLSQASLKKGNNAVPGGDSTQIEIIDFATGSFVIHVNTGDTTNMTGDVNIEIEVSNASGDITTVFHEFLVLKGERITWNDAV